MAVFSSCGQSPVWPCISAYAHSRVTGLGHDLSAFVYETQTAQACKITYFMQLVVCCTAFLYRVSVNNIYYGTYIPYVYMEQNDYVVFFQLTAELMYKMKKI